MKKKLFVFFTAWGGTLLNAHNLHIQTIQTHFTQKVTNEQGATVTYHGKMFANQRSNKALWEYTAPVHKKIYYTGDGKLVIIEPELEQAIFAKLHKVPNILKLLSEAKEGKKGELHTRFNSIDYTIHTNGNKITSIRYHDEMQNRVMISFTNEKINRFIDKRLFAYQIPSSYDILKQ